MYALYNLYVYHIQDNQIIERYRSEGVASIATHNHGQPCGQPCGQPVGSPAGSHVGLCGYPCGQPVGSSPVGSHVGSQVGLFGQPCGQPFRYPCGQPCGTLWVALWVAGGQPCGQPYGYPCGQQGSTWVCSSTLLCNVSDDANAQLYMTKSLTSSLFLTKLYVTQSFAMASSVKYSEIRQNCLNSAADFRLLLFVLAHLQGLLTVQRWHIYWACSQLTLHYRYVFSSCILAAFIQRYRYFSVVLTHLQQFFSASVLGLLQANLTLHAATYLLFLYTCSSCLALFQSACSCI